MENALNIQQRKQGKEKKMERGQGGPLSPLRLLEQNTIDKVAYKPQKFTAHGSGDREVQDGGAGRCSVW